ncbi:MAG: APC family permease [Synergistaceae bacterium]|nr:APC family permease [Synergistaceae bacterium]
MQNNDNDKHLIRNLTPLNVWSLAFGCVIGWSAFVMPGVLFLRNAGPLGTLIAMELATMVMLIISYNYSYMIHKFPLTGGEFIYAKMAFGEHHGFICAWFLSLSYLSVIPLNATALNLIMRAVFGNAFQFGFHYTVAGYDVYLGEMLLAIGAMIFFMFVNSLGVKFTGKIQTYMVMILLGGILIIISGTILNPNVSSSNLYPMFHPVNENFSKGIIAQIIAVFVTGPQSFVGFDTVPQLMEESKFSSDRVKVVMDTSIICGGFVYISLALIACAAFPAIYSSWPEYIHDMPNLSGISGIATLSASYTVMGKTGLFIITCSVIAAMLTGIVGFYTATSRLLYSMARDGMIPNWFAYINKNGVPTNAGLFCTVVSSLTCLMGRAVMGWVFDMASIGASIGFAYTSVSAAKYAWHERRLDILIFGLLGFMLSLGMAFLLLVPVDGLHVSLSNESYILLVIWSALGIVFYRYGGGGIRRVIYSRKKESIRE